MPDGNCEPDEVTESATGPTRREFLQKSGGVAAGLLGLFGLTRASGLFVSNAEQHLSGYGSSSYGGDEKEA